MLLRLAFLAALGSACTAVPAEEPAARRVARSADGLEIAWEERGAGEPTLVFVHGWCGERALWRTTLADLAPEHRVIALDLGGHGDSGRGRARWTLEALADDVILVGHSMGTTVCLLAAPRLAPRVRGVIGVESLHDARFRYPDGFLEDVARDLEQDFPRALEASLRRVVAPDAPPELLDWLRARALRTERAAAIGLLRGLEDFDVGHALAGAGVPVRVVNAAPRGPAGLGTAVEANRSLADFDALVLDKSGHFPMLEHPRVFLPGLRQWIRELSRVPRAGTR